MEKRKDIDMLRFYGGDIHQKNKEGEYVITNNLVNPKNKEDMLWGDRDAYRTLNALLFEGIENEKERIYKEKRKLNPVFIELIENTLEIYRGIFAVMCRKKGNQLSVSKIKRVDRKASLMAYLKWITWTSLRDCLQNLAELSPEAFLKEAERGIINNPTEIVNLFPPKSGELSGINYISNLLWALEILAWSPEYLVHSISVLGLLEALPYERTNGNY